MNWTAPFAKMLPVAARCSNTAMIDDTVSGSPRWKSAITAAPILACAMSCLALRATKSSFAGKFGIFAIKIVSLKDGFKGVTGGDRRGNAGHRCEAYRTGVHPETHNLGLHLVARIARAVTRFEDSLLGAAFGVALLFGLLIAVLSVGG